MGILAKTLAPTSSYAAKKTDLWPSLMARLTDCVLPAQVDDFEQWCIDNELQIPGAWQEPLAEKIAARREEIADEEIGLIVRNRFDF